MQEYQQRVLTERDELVERRDKLCAFLLGDVFAALSAADQTLLRLQFTIMLAYSQVLGERITRFPKG